MNHKKKKKRKGGGEDKEVKEKVVNIGSTVSILFFCAWKTKVSLMIKCLIITLSN